MTQRIHDWETDQWDAPEELYEFEGERLRRNSSAARIAGFLALGLIVIALLIGGGVGVWLTRQVSPPGEPGAKTDIVVSADDTIDTLSVQLETSGIITSAKVFRWYVRQKGGIELQAGSFSVRPKDDLGNIVRSLRTPPALVFDTVTFPEGFNLDLFGKRLQNKVPRLSAAQFVTVGESGQIRSAFQPEGINTLEGLIFPDTYQVAGNEDERKVLEKLVRQMERVGVREGLDKAQEKVGYSPYEVLIVASLIEREAKFNEDRPKIAQVIYNRLAAEKPFPLQIDATLYYRQPEGTPFAALRDIDTPYNTYLHTGLPPTPIASPGAASIYAALNPAPAPPLSECLDARQTCGYLYYVRSDKEGHHVFATDYDQHLANVAKAEAAGALA